MRREALIAVLEAARPADRHKSCAMETPPHVPSVPRNIHVFARSLRSASAQSSAEQPGGMREKGMDSPAQRAFRHSAPELERTLQRIADLKS